MLFLFFTIHIFALVSYKLNKLSKSSDTSKFHFITKKNNLVFYSQKSKDVYKPLPISQQINNLMNMDELRIEKNNSVYLIKPFEYFKIQINNELKSLGQFDELKIENKNVCFYYTNGDISKKTQVIFVLGEDETKIEKYFSGEASSLVYKIYGSFIGEKISCEIIHYLEENENESKNEETKEETKAEEEEDFESALKSVMQTLKSKLSSKQSEEKDL
ncbi:uncharacterized protein VNE69_04066 [Vairimorpha necatrix]|uniref:Uncharacterized protein n=1 Tax=Vairimorpha necatrix TaxID=6039 RepID=A0AAX4JBJ4_9MICR